MYMTAPVLEAIVAHARRDAPNECCGLLVGTGDRIDEAVATTNELASPTRYRVDPREHFALIRRLRGTARTIVGAYHSHPASPAAPSPADLAEAHGGDFLYVIVSLRNPATPEVRCYRISSEQSEEITLVTQ